MHTMQTINYNIIRVNVEHFIEIGANEVGINKR